MSDTLRERVNELICDVSEGRREVGEVRDAILALVAEDRAGGCPSCGMTAERFHELLKAEARERVLMKALQDTADTRDALKAREAALVVAMDGLLKRCEDMEHSRVHVEGAKLFAASIAGTLGSIRAALKETP